MIDERVKSQMNQIRSEMLAIIIYILIASIFVKIFFLGGDLKDVITEYIIFVFVAIYQFLRARSLKMNMADLLPEKKKLIIREVTAITGGKGGGKPDMAQGGGKDKDKIDEAIIKAEDILSSQIK